MTFVNHGQFSFDGRTFNVASSEGHIHRRASHADLRALFDTSMPDRSGRPDYAAHWYEAQLLHYGLPSSKKKVTAKMRLLDALQDGTLKIPMDILKIEKDLRKEWEEKDFEDRLLDARIHGPENLRFENTVTGTKSATRTTSNSQGAPGRHYSTSFSTDSIIGASMSSFNRQQQKRTAGSSDPTPSKKPKKEQLPPEPLQNTGCSHGHSGATFNLHLNTNIISNGSQGVSTSPRPRRMEYGSRQSENPFPQPRYETMPLSRESSYVTNSSDVTSGPFGVDEMDNDECYEYSYAPSSYSTNSTQSSRTLTQSPRLGLINGEYDIYSSDFQDWPEVVPFEGFNLALCIDDNKKEIWGEFRFGVLCGIMHMPQRPMGASERSFHFEWRGRDVTGDGNFPATSEGWIRFLGDGEIDGQIEAWAWLRFNGQRVRGQGISRPRDLYALKREWVAMCV